MNTTPDRHLAAVAQAALHATAFAPKHGGIHHGDGRHSLPVTTGPK
jgi:hypothetical protein